MASSHHQLITCSSNGSRKLPKSLRLFGKEADDRVDALEVKKEVVFLSLRTNALLLQGSKDKDEGDGAQEAAAGFTPEKIIWWQVCLRLQDNQIFAFASTCRLFREIQKETRPEITTTVQKYFRSMPVVTTEWLMWSFKQLKEDDMISTSGKETYARECLAAIACHNENQQAIELLKSLGCPFNEWCTQSAATKGNLALLKFLAGEGTCMDEGTCSGAAYGGHLQVLQWARSLGCPWDEETCALAAQKGHLMVLMWACSQGCPWGATLFRMASEAGELEIMQWLLTQGWNLEWETYWVAIRKAQFHVIEWLQRGGWEIGKLFFDLFCTCLAFFLTHFFFSKKKVPGTLAYAAREGRLNVLRWLRVRNCPWDEDTCTGAAKGGHLEILKWLQSEGCPWDEDTCAGAAEGGHLDILRWLRSEGCPWDEFTCVRAAEGGNLEILKWLQSEGCPWDEDTCTGAVEGGHLDVLEHAIGEGCEWNIGKLLAVAARKGHVHILSWLESNGCLDVFESESIWGPAIEEGHLHVLDWMNSHRYVQLSFLFFCHFITDSCCLQLV